MTPTLRQADLSLPGLLRQLHPHAADPAAAVTGFAEAKVAHNTYAYVETSGSTGALTVGVVLHSTTIARFTRISSTELEDGAATPDLWLLTLNTGGWDTVTTRDRLNRILRPLGLNVSRSRGDTWVHEVGVTLADGRHVLGDRPLARHDGHALPVATVLVDGARVIHPELGASDLQRLVDRGVRPVGLLAARPEAAA